MGLALEQLAGRGRLLAAAVSLTLVTSQVRQRRDETGGGGGVERRREGGSLEEGQTGWRRNR
eukprot:432601-Hanusia_phi.AAC.1